MDNYVCMCVCSLGVMFTLKLYLWKSPWSSRLIRRKAGARQIQIQKVFIR